MIQWLILAHIITKTSLKKTYYKSFPKTKKKYLALTVDFGKMNKKYLCKFLFFSKGTLRTLITFFRDTVTFFSIEIKEREREM